MKPMKYLCFQRSAERDQQIPLAVWQ